MPQQKSLVFLWKWVHLLVFLQSCINCCFPVHVFEWSAVFNEGKQRDAGAHVQDWSGGVQWAGFSLEAGVCAWGCKAGWERDESAQASCCFQATAWLLWSLSCYLRGFVVWAKIKQRWSALRCVCLPLSEGFEKEHWGMWLKVKLPLWVGAMAWTDLLQCVDRLSQTSRGMHRFYLKYKHGMWRWQLLLQNSQVLWMVTTVI